jgi:hypothetical protein
MRAPFFMFSFTYKTHLKVNQAPETNRSIQLFKFSNTEDVIP